ncbi:right-handed parallel beta-helix repeat-containing protein [Sorangium sp. So ce448]|uniref:right-handed parallel beta-helix repeat-containing protein n=1 Tax=Sorangium sp. So ce448 TaxID=3133314 RepID=UPI003F626F62
MNRSRKNRMTPTMHRYAPPGALLLAVGLFPACATQGGPDASDSDTLGAGLASSATMTCSKLTVLKGSTGGQGAQALATKDLSGTADTWSKYVEFNPGSQAQCEYALPAGASDADVSALSLSVNYRGPAKADMLWTFDAWDYSTSTWVKIGDNAFASSWAWSAATLALPSPHARFVSGGKLKIRYGTTSTADASDIDLLVLNATLTSGPPPECVPETDAQLCSRLARSCGPLSANDSCGSPRTVASCGTCSGAQTCGGGGSPGVCGDAGSTSDPDPDPTPSPVAGACGDRSSGRTITVAPSGGDHRTIQAGLNAAAAGDTVVVKAGTYNEKVSFTRSGTASAGCITLKGEAGAILDGTGKSGVGIDISSKNYIKVTGMTVQNFKGSGDTPMGISVSGSSSFLEIRNNLVHHIESSQDAHGIAFYGTSATPMTDLLIDGNEIRDCKLGSSEAMVLNGNVTKFVVSRNTVHDNDNIGIDFIGFEGTGPSGSDQARDGVCVDNIVYNISSAGNPAYDGERSADGIYVDGGKDIVIERNKVDSSDIGIEIASEHAGRTTSNITVRNNFVSRSYQGNIMIGGYDTSRGNAADIAVLNNTLYQGAGGEIILQNNANGVLIQNNILRATSGKDYVSSGSNNRNVTVDNNIFFGASRSSAGAFSDPRARFVDPLLVGPPSDLHLTSGSPAVDAGIDLGSRSGATDIDGGARTSGARIDIGADER